MSSKINKTTINSHLTGTSQDYEYDALFALLKAQPRVAAPTDFDFKLRARIARAELEPSGSLKQIEQVGLAHWLAGFWAKSFRPSQALVGLAAVALFAVASVLFINRSTNSTPPLDGHLAVVTSGSTSANLPTPANAEIVNTPAVKAEVVRIATAAPKMTAVKATAVSFRPRFVPEAQSQNIASTESTASFYRRDKGQMGRISNRPVSLGAEDAALAKPQTIALSF